MSIIPDVAAETVNPCPCCGAYSGTTLAVQPAILAMCDSLVLKALENVGKRLLRTDRSRYSRRGDTPMHSIHVLWTPDPAMVCDALKGAWDVVPAVMGNQRWGDLTAAQMTGFLDRYTRNLAETGRSHNPDMLQLHLGHFFVEVAR